jgi:hypothetical protein
LTTIQTIYLEPIFIWVSLKERIESITDLELTIIKMEINLKGYILRGKSRVSARIGMQVVTNLRDIMSMVRRTV